MSLDSYWYKEDENAKVWWLYQPHVIGEFVFSFDKKKQYNLYRDYPYKLTKEEKEIFDRENPFWADYFKERE